MLCHAKLAFTHLCRSQPVKHSALGGVIIALKAIGNSNVNVKALVPKVRGLGALASLND